MSACLCTAQCRSGRLPCRFSAMSQPRQADKTFLQHLLVASCHLLSWRSNRRPLLVLPLAPTMDCSTSKPGHLRHSNQASLLLHSPAQHTVRLRKRTGLVLKANLLLFRPAMQDCFISRPQFPMEPSLREYSLVMHTGAPHRVQCQTFQCEARQHHTPSACNLGYNKPKGMTTYLGPVRVLTQGTCSLGLQHSRHLCTCTSQLSPLKPCSGAPPSSTLGLGPARSTPSKHRRYLLYTQELTTFAGCRSSPCPNTCQACITPWQACPTVV